MALFHLSKNIFLKVLNSSLNLYIWPSVYTSFFYCAKNFSFTYSVMNLKSPCICIVSLLLKKLLVIFNLLKLDKSSQNFDILIFSAFTLCAHYTWNRYWYTADKLRLSHSHLLNNLFLTNLSTSFDMLEHFSVSSSPDLYSNPDNISSLNFNPHKYYSIIYIRLTF